MLQQILAVTELRSLALDPAGLNNSFMCCSIFLLQKYTIHLVFRKYLLRTSRWLAQLLYGIKTSESFLVLFIYSSHKLREMNTQHFHASLKLFQQTWVTCSISSSTTKIYQICWSTGNALDLYLGGAWFKSWSGH
jgi:hypothetical protein